jgi:hypothetical protein
MMRDGGLIDQALPRKINTTLKPSGNSKMIIGGMAPVGRKEIPASRSLAIVSVFAVQSRKNNFGKGRLK